MDRFITGRADEHAAAIKLRSSPTHTFKHAFSHASLLSIARSILSLHFLVTLVQTLVHLLVQVLPYQLASVHCVCWKGITYSHARATTVSNNTSSWRITWGRCLKCCLPVGHCLADVLIQNLARAAPPVQESGPTTPMFQAVLTGFPTPLLKWFPWKKG
jgi:hypothetical protein